MQWILLRDTPSPLILKLSAQNVKSVLRETWRATAFIKPSPFFQVLSVKKKIINSVVSQHIRSFFHWSLGLGLMFHEQYLKLSRSTCVELHCQKVIFSRNYLPMTSAEKVFSSTEMYSSEMLLRKMYLSSKCSSVGKIKHHSSNEKLLVTATTNHLDTTTPQNS